MEFAQIFLILLGLAFAQALENDHLRSRWVGYKSRFAKRYANSAEEEHRRAVWEKSIQFIEEHNRLYEQGLKSYTLRENKFADMDDEEFRTKVLMQKSFDISEIREDGVPHRTYVQRVGRDVRDSELPDSIDWRAVGAVAPIKNQGHCGSCYTFAAVAALESHWKLYSKDRIMTTLSEQELVDCSWPETNEGCNGGLAVQCYKYILRNGRISTEKAYPYEAINTTCRANNDDPSSFGASMKTYAVTKPLNAQDMKHALATQGPISIHVDASPNSFKLYDGTIGEGVYEETKCVTNKSNHAMLAVGYGVTKNGTEYWIVRNSWSDDWGIKGYVHIRRGINNCAIEWYGGEYPIVPSGDVDPTSTRRPNSTSSVFLCRSSVLLYAFLVLMATYFSA